MKVEQQKGEIWDSVGLSDLLPLLHSEKVDFFEKFFAALNRKLSTSEFKAALAAMYRGIPPDYLAQRMQKNP